MPRLFTGLEIPATWAEELSMLRGGIPGARWIDPENYHMTLRFIGDVDDALAGEIASLLGQVGRLPGQFRHGVALGARSCLIKPADIHDWDMEHALDVECVHAVPQRAKIVSVGDADGAGGAPQGVNWLDLNRLTHLALNVGAL